MGREPALRLCCCRPKGTIAARVRRRTLGHVELADLVCGGATLDGREGQEGQEGQEVRTTIREPSVNSGPGSERPAALSPAADQNLSRRSSHKFTVGLVAEGVTVDGLIIECDTSALPYLGFTELMEQAIEDVAAGLDISPLTAKKIAERIKGKLPAGTVNPETVQRGLKRLDRRIVERLRQEARFIDKGDIIENVARAKNYRGRLGFQLNSDKIAIDPRTLKRR